MTTEEILQIGKVERDIENIAIIERFKEQISSWLKSDKFQQIAEEGGSLYEILVFWGCGGIFILGNSKIPSLRAKRSNL